MQNHSKKIIDLLGPTNTGKTQVAIEKMLEFDSGIFGLPLRLLAREVYDKLKKTHPGWNDVLHKASKAPKSSVKPI